MSNLKKELINIKQQIRNLINVQESLEQHIQNLIDGIESSAEIVPEAIESYIHSLMSERDRQWQSKLDEEREYFNKKIDEIKNSVKEKQTEVFTSSSISAPFLTNQKAILENDILSCGKINLDSSTNTSSTSSQRMVELYNENINYFNNFYQTFEVDATQDSIEMIRTKSNAPIVLSRVSTRGKFWVVESNGYGHLFPNPRQLFHEHNLDVVKALFNDSNYYDGYKKIHLELPAKIGSLKSTDPPAWQLIEKGTVSFM